MADKPLQVKKFTVKEAGHKMDIIVPQSDDPSYDNYVAEVEIAKTRDELRKKPSPQPVNKGARETLGAQLKEFSEYRRRKSENINKRYF